MTIRHVKEWRAVKLKDVCHEITVGHVGPMKDQYIDKGIPFLRSQNVRPFKFDSSGLCYISTQFHAKLKKSALSPGDVVVTRTGANTGQCCVIPKKLRVANCADLVIFRPSGSIDSQFLMYVLNSSWGRATIAGGVVGAAQHHFNIGIAKEVLVQLPDISTQRKIALILSAYDDLIENNTRRIAILEEMAQAIYREWFVNFRFPGHENVKLVQSTLGMIPEGWEIAIIENLVKRLQAGKKYDQKTVTVEGKVPVLDQGKLGIIGYHNDEPGLVATEDNPVITFANHTCYQRIIHFPFSAIQNVLPFVPCPEVHRNLYWLHWATKNVISFNDYKGHWPEFMAKQIVLPPSHLCQAFGMIARDSELSVLNLQRRNQLLRFTRDLLLPKLISGQLDVEEIDIDLATAEEIGEPTAKPIEQKRAVRATPEIDEASTASTTSISEPIPIDELDVDQVMAEFRQQARRLGTKTRGDLLKAVSLELGYKQLGHNIEEVLTGHLRAAIRRKIIAADGELVCLHTPSMETYERDELIEAFHSVMRKNTSYVREDVIRALANHLGFRRISDTVREPIKSAINGAIRRGVLGYQGELIWREG